jgi:hypothetical protein
VAVSDNYRAALRDVAAGFTRLTGRETRTVEGRTRPLLAFGYEVGDGTRL